MVFLRIFLNFSTLKDIALDCDAKLFKKKLSRFATLLIKILKIKLISREKMLLLIFLIHYCRSQQFYSSSSQTKNLNCFQEEIFFKTLKASSSLQCVEKCFRLSECVRANFYPSEHSCHLFDRFYRKCSSFNSVFENCKAFQLKSDFFSKFFSIIGIF